MSRPTLKTRRLTLRPFERADAFDVTRLAGERDIADTTLNIPHPYVTADAEAWIDTHPAEFDADRLITLAMIGRATNALIGAIGLRMDRPMNKGDLGYWVGKPYWNKGFATEAAIGICDYGFRSLGLHRITAQHLARNPSSGRVMQKLGMQREGLLRQHTMKWGKYEDLVTYGLLKEEWSL